MTRIPRSLQVLVVVAALVLVTVPFASARPLETPQATHRTDSDWIVTALRWVEDLVGIQGSRSDRASGLPSPAQKDGKLPGPTGSSCLDPHGGCS